MVAPPLRTSRGFSLIELMVALVVVSLGLGGILMSQAQGLMAATGSGYRIQAAVLGEQILDRARANATGAYTVSESVSPGGSTVAEQDLRRWKEELSRALPDGDGSIDVRVFNDGATGESFEELTVRVGWLDRRPAPGVAADRRYVLIQGVRAR